MRENGHYWVKATLDSDYRIAYFEHGKWLFIGTSSVYDIKMLGEDLFEVGKRIVRE